MMWQTAEELNLELAKRLKAIRKRQRITQKQLAVQSNVSYGSIKRFEATGNISLISLTHLCISLKCEGELRELFTNVGYNDISEVVHETGA